MCIELVIRDVVHGIVRTDRIKVLKSSLVFAFNVMPNKFFKFHSVVRVINAADFLIHFIFIIKEICLVCSWWYLLG